MTVWVVVDDKYGPQLVCATESVAEAHRLTGKYDISGMGAAVVPFEVITEPPAPRKRKR